MRAQLQHLLTKIDERQALVQVIPFSAGMHLGMNGSFALLKFDPASQDVVYIELGENGLFLEGEGDSKSYNQTFSDLQDAASDPRDSRAIISSVLESM